MREALGLRFQSVCGGNYFPKITKKRLGKRKNWLGDGKRSRSVLGVGGRLFWGVGFVGISVLLCDILKKYYNG